MSRKISSDLQRKSKRQPKPSPIYQRYMADIREKKITARHWSRSFPGDVITHINMSSLSADNELAEDLGVFKENLKNSRGYKDQSDIKFDSNPKKKTPKKGVTITPRKRKFKNTTTTRIEFLDKDRDGEKIRLVSFQEDKFALSVNENSTQYGDENNVEEEELKLFSKRLSDLKDEEDASIVKIEKNISKQTLTKQRKRKAGSTGRKDKLSISADDLCAYYLKNANCPLNEEQKLIQSSSHHELSHLVARSHGGGLMTLPTTEGHNSKRIPIEILVPFFIKLGLKIKFATIDNLLCDTAGAVTLLPEKETIVITLPEIQRRITFELDPLCPEQPVHGCFDIAKQVAILALSGTDYAEPAKKLLEKQNKRKKSKDSRCQVGRYALFSPSLKCSASERSLSRGRDVLLDR